MYGGLWRLLERLQMEMVPGGAERGAARTVAAPLHPLGAAAELSERACY